MLKKIKLGASFVLLRQVKTGSTRVGLGHSRTARREDGRHVGRSAKVDMLLDPTTVFFKCTHSPRSWTLVSPTSSTHRRTWRPDPRWAVFRDGLGKKTCDVHRPDWRIWRIDPSWALFLGRPLLDLTQIKVKFSHGLFKKTAFSETRSGWIRQQNVLDMAKFRLRIHEPAKSVPPTPLLVLHLNQTS